MNSTLQCLSHVPDLSAYFLSGRFTSHRAWPTGGGGGECDRASFAAVHPLVA
jgi:hypothetical protein